MTKSKYYPLTGKVWLALLNPGGTTLGALPFKPEEHVPKLATGEVVLVLPPRSSQSASWPQLFPSNFSAGLLGTKHLKPGSQSASHLEALHESVSEEQWALLLSEAWADYCSFYELRRR
ncbi:hypothetical protein JCM6882_009456 [Rhodosporidiobolus microsporus]